jgi:twitching motility protein PilT
VSGIGLLRIGELLDLARARAASDLHLGAGQRPSLRIDGRLVMLEVEPVAPEALAAFCSQVLGAEGGRRLSEAGSADAAVRSGAGAPYRLHAYRSAAGLRAAYRLHAVAVPALERLGLPPIVASFVGRPNGLVLFTGPTGSGKTTALAALVDRINRTSERLVVAVEDPIEYVHAPLRSLIVHCAVGTDVADYDEALRGFLRADPDVILVGEMRDRATIEAVLTAAETGHLVLSTLHTNDAPQTIDRIIDAFPSAAHAQVRNQLAATLIAIVSLRLVPRRDGPGRAAACEVLVGTDAVRAMIREGKTHQLHNALATGRAAGMQPLEVHLSELVVGGHVDLDAARAVANRPADVRALGRAG